jgi:hypothetical protein
MNGVWQDVIDRWLRERGAARQLEERLASLLPLDVAAVRLAASDRTSGL